MSPATCGACLERADLGESPAYGPDLRIHYAVHAHVQSVLTWTDG